MTMADWYLLLILMNGGSKLVTHVHTMVVWYKLCMLLRVASVI